MLGGLFGRATQVRACLASAAGSGLEQTSRLVPGAGQLGQAQLPVPGEGGSSCAQPWPTSPGC